PGVIEGAEFVFTCLGDDPDVADVFGKIEASLKPGQIVVDHTTASADLARDLAKRSASQGAAFLDAPVSGGQAGAENGQLTVMVGGDQATFDRARPVIDAYAKMVGLLGPVGSGQLTKMVNQ